MKEEDLKIMAKIIENFIPKSEGELKRQESNREILSKISELVKKYPDQRFWQLLYNMRIINVKDDIRVIKDDYNKESIDILKDIRDF